MYVFIFSLFEYILASIRDFFAGLLDAINTGYEESFKQLSESFADEIDDPIAVDSIQFLNQIAHKGELPESWYGKPIDYQEALR